MRPRDYAGPRCNSNIAGKKRWTILFLKWYSCFVVYIKQCRISYAVVINKPYVSKPQPVEGSATLQSSSLTWGDWGPQQIPSWGSIIATRGFYHHLKGQVRTHRSCRGFHWLSLGTLLLFTLHCSKSMEWPRQRSPPSAQAEKGLHINKH